MADKKEAEGASRGPNRKVDLNRVIRDLNEEKARLTRIIERLEQIRAESAPDEKPRSRRGRKSMDAAGRQEVAQRMRDYWKRWRAQRTNSNQPGTSSGSSDNQPSRFGTVSYGYTAEGA